MHESPSEQYLRRHLNEACVQTFPDPAECKISRDVTYKCRNCLWTLVVPVEQELEGLAQWSEHYSEKCSCASPGCKKPKTSGSALCDYHDTYGEEYSFWD